MVAKHAGTQQAIRTFVTELGATTFRPKGGWCCAQRTACAAAPIGLRVPYARLAAQLRSLSRRR
eukprot:5018493-Pleurochrysis_carterae.AAC.2